MSYEIEADYGVQFLLPQSLEDWVSADHPVRVIREIVEHMDLSEFETKVSRTGRPRYSKRLLLKAWVFAYFERIHSSRALEKACHDNIALVWLLGMQKPDHNTLWRFWKKNKDFIKGFFKQTIDIASKLGMIGMVVHAIDGTKIKAKASRDIVYKRRGLEKQLKDIEASIEQMGQRIEEEAKEGFHNERLPEHLQNAKTLQSKVKSALKTLNKEEQADLSPHEPEARVMKTRNGLDLCYNGQAGADSKESIIVCADLGNEAGDAAMMGPMLDQIEKNMGGYAQESLFDAGYDTYSEIHDAETNGANILVNDQNRKQAASNPYHTAHFRHDLANDQMICPITSYPLVFERCKTKKKKKGDSKMRVFRCKNKECPFREKCTKDKRGRSVEIYWPHHPAVQRQRDKRRKPENKLLLKTRMPIIEPVFAQIKWNLGFTRYTMWGMERAKSQWLFICSIHNLKRILSFVKRNPEGLSLQQMLQIQAEQSNSVKWYTDNAILSRAA
jgi:transposase